MVTRRTKNMLTAVTLVVAAAAIVVLWGCSKQPSGAEVSSTTPPPEGEQSGPGTAPAGQEIVLDVYVPCAFADAATEIAVLFEKANPGVRVNRTVENVSTLKPRIANGAKPDVFMCIGDREVIDLEAKGLVDSKRDFCFTSIVLVVPQANPAKIQTIKDLAKPEVKTIALAADDVSAGYYARKVLEENGLWDKVQKKLVRPKFPVELLKLASQGKVQASLAYAACFRAEGGDQKQTAAKIKLITDFLDKYCQSVACSAAVIKGCSNPEQAKAFLDFLTRPECQEIFAKSGFMKLDDPKCFTPAGKEKASASKPSA